MKIKHWHYEKTVTRRLALLNSSTFLAVSSTYFFLLNKIKTRDQLLNIINYNILNINRLHK